MYKKKPDLFYKKKKINLGYQLWSKIKIVTSAQRSRESPDINKEYTKYSELKTVQNNNN